MSGLPTGTVTFLFTDIDGSTRIAQDLGDTALKQILADHRRLLVEAVESAGGNVYQDQGDSFLFVFPRARNAVLGAIAAQRALRHHAWPEGYQLDVRMGVHTGEPVREASEYVGLDVHRVARISSAGHGGQILVSQTTYDLVADDFPDGVGVRNLGDHRLKDLTRPLHLYQVVTPDLPTDFPALKTLDSLPNNLPRQLTSFIGREREIEEVKRLLSSTRLLTLTGTGGIGKTRLAIQVAAEVLDLFKHGVWLVELASLSDASLVPQTISSILGVREHSRRSILEMLSDFLQPKELLLVLDNAEHLTVACAQLVDTLVRTCPNVRILTTSRVPLHLRWEQQFPLSPLDTPDPNSSLPEEIINRSPAVALFVMRARSVRPDFQLDRDSARYVAAICRRLDGLPLAIELAAARTKVLSPRAIYDRLVASPGQQSIRLLTSHLINVPARHRTLTDAITWSYQLLERAQQALFRRLGVFQGGCTLEAATAVCILGDSKPEIFDDLSALIDHSLLQRVLQPDGQPRFRMLQTIRDSAVRLLNASGEADIVRARHADFFAGFAEEAEPHLWGRDQTTWLDRVDTELDNIRTALDWALSEPGDPEVGLRLGASLHRFWDKSGYLSEGRQTLERLLARYPQPSPARVKMLITVSLLAFFQGDYADARLEESLQMARALNDAWGIAYSLVGLGVMAHAGGDVVRAVSLLQESLRLSQEAGLRHSAGASLSFLASIALVQGDYLKAEALGNEGARIFKELEDTQSTVHAFLATVVALLLQRHNRRAAVLLQDHLPLTRDLKDKFLLAACLDGVAWLAANEGEFDLCARLLGAAGALRESIGATEHYHLPTAQVHSAPSVRVARSRLGEARFAAVRDAGAQSPLNMVLEDALAFTKRPRLTDHGK